MRSYDNMEYGKRVFMKSESDQDIAIYLYYNYNGEILLNYRFMNGNDKQFESDSHQLVVLKNGSIDRFLNSVVIDGVDLVDII